MLKQQVEHGLGQARRRLAFTGLTLGKNGAAFAAMHVASVGKVAPKNQPTCAGMATV